MTKLIDAAVAALRMATGTMTSARTSLTSADKQHPPVTPESSTETGHQVQQRIWDEDGVQEVVVSFADKVGFPADETEEALREIAGQLYPMYARASTLPDPVALRAEITNALVDRLETDEATVDRAITEQIVESYQDHSTDIDAQLDRAVAFGYLTSAEGDELRRQAVDGSVGMTR